MARRLRRLAFASLLVPGGLLLTGCGFHLRGASPLPQAMERLELRGVSPYSPLADTISDVFTEAGADIVAAGAGADAVLSLENERFDRRVSSVDVAGKATQYELRYTLRGTLLDSSSNSLVPAQHVSVVRMMNFDSDNVLGTASEEELLMREMRRDGARQLLRRLRTALEHRGRTP